MSLTRQVAHLTMRRLSAATGFALGLLLLSFLGTSVPVQVTTTDNGVPAPDKPPAPTRAERLIAEHGCWTDRAPTAHTGALPGHVVVSRPGHGATRSARLVGPALDQVVSDTGGDLVVHAFCP